MNLQANNDKPSFKAMEYAAYIPNHYSRKSHVDKVLLALDLERHGWVSEVPLDSKVPIDLKHITVP